MLDFGCDTQLLHSMVLYYCLVFCPVAAVLIILSSLCKSSCVTVHQLFTRNRVGVLQRCQLLQGHMLMAAVVTLAHVKILCCKTKDRVPRRHFKARPQIFQPVIVVLGMSWCSAVLCYAAHGLEMRLCYQYCCQDVLHEEESCGHIQPSCEGQASKVCRELLQCNCLQARKLGIKHFARHRCACSVYQTCGKHSL